MSYFGKRLRQPYFRIMTELRMEISYIARIKEARRQVLTQSVNSNQYMMDAEMCLDCFGGDFDAELDKPAVAVS